MDEQTFTKCPGCDEPVDPTDADVIYAVKIELLETMGGPNWTEGMGAFFHGGHFPHDSVRWRQKPKP